MAYEVGQDRLRALLPNDFHSLRPVLRINAEIRADNTTYMELNTAVGGYGKRGWLNIAHQDSTVFNISYQKRKYNNIYCSILNNYFYLKELLQIKNFVIVNLRGIFLKPMLTASALTKHCLHFLQNLKFSTKNKNFLYKMLLLYPVNRFQTVMLWYLNVNKNSLSYNVKGSFFKVIQ